MRMKRAMMTVHIGEAAEIMLASAVDKDFTTGVHEKKNDIYVLRVDVWCEYEKKEMLPMGKCFMP